MVFVWWSSALVYLYLPSSESLAPSEPISRLPSAILTAQPGRRSPVLERPDLRLKWELDLKRLAGSASLPFFSLGL